MSKKKELGKGLRALLSNIENNNSSEERSEVVKELNSNINEINLSDIEVNPFQPRTEFSEQELVELAQSIKVHGLIQPITVRSLANGKYQLISGERRMRASKIAGLKVVPAYIRIANDQEMLEMALIENIQRQELNAIEIAISYQRLMDECKLTHENLSERVGKNRSTVTNYVRLLKLPPEIQNAIKSTDISMGHARALAGVKDVMKQIDAFNQIKEKGLSVRATEALLKSSGDDIVKKRSKIGAALSAEDIQVDKIKSEISKLVGSKVDIKRDASGKGSIVIKFRNDREFNSIYDLFKELE